MTNVLIQKNRFVSLALALLICGVHIGTVANTNAYFSDVETGGENIFSATSVDLAIDDELFEYFQLFGATTTSEEVTVSNEGESSFFYRTSVDDVSLCDADFLEDTTMTATYNGDQVYVGSIDTFTVDTLDTSGVWEFAFLLDGESNTAHDAECTFDVVFLAWDEHFVEPGIGGFYDTEAMTISLTASGVVLNEILANPEGSDALSIPFGEWVELYNNSSSNVNLTGWYIKDADGNVRTIDATRTPFGRTTIFAKNAAFFTDWLVVFMNGTTLDNPGEAVYLYDNNNQLRDMYAYGNKSADADLFSHITAGYTNNSGVVGPEVAGQEGKSDARIPDGYGVWIDPVPTPGGPNTLDVVLAMPLSEEIIATEVLIIEDAVLLPIGENGAGRGNNDIQDITDEIIENHEIEPPVIDIEDIGTADLTEIREEDITEQVPEVEEIEGEEEEVPQEEEEVEEIVVDTQSDPEAPSELIE